MTQRARIIVDRQGRYRGIVVACPECDGHFLPTDWTPEGMERAPDVEGRPQWGFNGNLERPTVNPSIKYSRGHFCEGKQATDCAMCKMALEEGKQSPCTLCHSFVRDGHIQYLRDSSHERAGQTIELPDIGSGVIQQ